MASPTMQDTVRTTSTAAAASVMWTDAQRRPVYRRGLAPEGLCTASQLRAKRLSPAGLTPVAWLYFAYTGHQICPLYAVEQARPIRALTDRQRAALAAGRALAGYADGPYTLHQLRHSRLTHAAEEGASTPVLMKLSGHTSVRSLVKYARVSDEGLRRYQADSDPAVRRRGR